MNVGDWVMYEATHQRNKERRVGKLRWVRQTWVDVTWYWVQEPSNTAVFASSTVALKYCTPLTKEVADLIIYSHNEKE